MLKEELAELLDLSKAVCIRPSEQFSLSAQEILNRLANFPDIKKNSLVVVNDQYRATPSAMMIKLLRELGKIKHPLTFILATGSHEPPTKAEAASLTDAKENDTIIFHGVNMLKHYSNGGITSRGTEILYNPAIDEFENIITIGSVEPHYFAGFTGGAKSLMPGIVSKKTITQNHRWAIDPNAVQMKTKGNPVFEDIWEAAELIKPLDQVFTIQLVNHGNSILHLSTGKMHEAFENAKLKSEECFGKVFNRKFDRIITFVQPPLNSNLYQSQKAADNTKNVLKDGGSLVLISQCNRGIGARSFFDRLSKLGSPENVLKKLSFENYELGDHKSICLAKLALNAELFFVGGLSESEAATAYMKKISVQQLAEMYKKWTASGDSVLIDEAGGFTSYCYRGINF